MGRGALAPREILLRAVVQLTDDPQCRGRLVSGRRRGPRGGWDAELAARADRGDCRKGVGDCRGRFRAGRGGSRGEILGRAPAISTPRPDLYAGPPRADVDRSELAVELRIRRVIPDKVVRRQVLDDASHCAFDVVRID